MDKPDENTLTSALIKLMEKYTEGPEQASSILSHALGFIHQEYMHVKDPECLCIARYDDSFVITSTRDNIVASIAALEKFITEETTSTVH